MKKDLFAARERNGIFLSPENYRSAFLPPPPSLSLSLTADNLSAYSGMENLIKSQKDMITELEAKIETNMEELKKVSSLRLYNLPHHFTFCR